MEQLHENNAEQADNATSTPSSSLGMRLREAREHLGLSVADAAYQTKLAPRQIEALEADDFKKLPEMTFVRGFVRSYAKTLNLDAQPLLATLPQAKEVSAQLTPVSVEVLFPDAYSSQRQNRIWLGAALLLVVSGGAFLVWHYITPDTKAKTTQVEKVTTIQTEPQFALPDRTQAVPVSAVPEVNVIALSAASAVQPLSGAAQSSVSAAKPMSLPQAQSTKPAVQPDVVPHVSKLRFEFDEDSWVEIRDKDDKVLSSQVNPRGSELRLNGSAPFSLVIGHSASVRLYHRGKQVDLTPYISPSSEVARLTLE